MIFNTYYNCCLNTEVENGSQNSHKNRNNLETVTSEKSSGLHRFWFWFYGTDIISVIYRYTVNSRNRYILIFKTESVCAFVCRLKTFEQ